MAAPLVAAIGVLLGTTVVGMVTRVLVALGFYWVAYQGIGGLWGVLEAAIWTNLGGAGAGVLAVLQLARVDDAITLVLSALTAVMTWKGLFTPLIWRLVRS